jgi:septal ring factor EnvC (AmiA/AmiB activator)
MVSIWYALQLVGIVLLAVIGGGTALAFIWYSIRHRIQADWRERCEQLENELADVKVKLKETTDERDRLQREVKQLKDDYIGLSQINNRQQGEIDRMKRQIEDLGNLRGEVGRLIAELKR